MSVNIDASQKLNLENLDALAVKPRKLRFILIVKPRKPGRVSS